MEIKELIRLQKELDNKAGFETRFSSNPSKYNQLTKELVGLFGEIGEFSNIIKKINLSIDNKRLDLNIPHAENCLREELIDALIYIIRISEILEIDIEKEFLKKLAVNKKKYLNE